MYKSRDDFVTCRSFEGIPGDISATAITSTHARIKNLTSSTPVAVGISFPTENVAAGTYTNASLTVNSIGHITAVSDGLSASVSADPTNEISGQAKAGSATTYMRSDAAPGLEKTGVTAGEYNNASINVDTYGRITSASAGTSAVLDVVAHETIIFNQIQHNSQVVSVLSTTDIKWSNDSQLPWINTLVDDTNTILVLQPGEYRIYAQVTITGDFEDRISYIFQLWDPRTDGELPIILESSTYYRGTGSINTITMVGSERIIVPVGSTRECVFKIRSVDFVSAQGGCFTIPSVTLCRINKITMTGSTTSLSSGSLPMVLTSKIIIDSNGHSLFAPGRRISGDSRLGTATPEIRRVLLTPVNCLIDSSTSQVVHTFTNSNQTPPNALDTEVWLVGGVRSSSPNNEIFYYINPHVFGFGDGNWKVVNYRVNMGTKGSANASPTLLPSETDLRTVFLVRKARLIGPEGNLNSTIVTDYLVEHADRISGTNITVPLTPSWTPAGDEYAFIWVATTSSNHVTVSAHIDLMRVSTLAPMAQVPMGPVSIPPALPILM